MGQNFYIFTSTTRAPRKAFGLSHLASRSSLDTPIAPSHTHGIGQSTL